MSNLQAERSSNSGSSQGLKTLPLNMFRRLHGSLKECVRRQTSLNRTPPRDLVIVQLVLQPCKTVGTP
eukprot:2470147-Amphidinium_carterae.1